MLSTGEQSKVGDWQEQTAIKIDQGYQVTKFDKTTTVIEED